MLITVILTALALVASADTGTAAATQSQQATIPQWLFTWVMALGTAAGGILLTVIKILWSESRKSTGLSPKQDEMLKEVHRAVGEVPKTWAEVFDEITETQRESKLMLSRIIELCEGDRAQLQAQIQDRLRMHDELQDRMVRLALRVQRAVEALAGLKEPDIGSDL